MYSQQTWTKNDLVEMFLRTFDWDGADQDQYNAMFNFTLKHGEANLISNLKNYGIEVKKLSMDQYCIEYVNNPVPTCKKDSNFYSKLNNHKYNFYE